MYTAGSGVMLPQIQHWSSAGTLGPTDLVVDTAGQETLMSAQELSCQPSLETRPPFGLGVMEFLLGGTHSSHSLPWTALSSSAVILCPVVK